MTKTCGTTRSERLCRVCIYVDTAHSTRVSLTVPKLPQNTLSLSLSLDIFCFCVLLIVQSTMNEYAFTTSELKTILFAPPVCLDSTSRCVQHRDTLLSSLQQNNKEALDACLASMLNSNAKGCINYISRSSLDATVKDIALSKVVETTKTAKRLAILLTHEWIQLITAKHKVVVHEYKRRMQNIKKKSNKNGDTSTHTWTTQKKNTDMSCRR